MGRPAEETETMTTSKAVLALCLVGAAVAAPQLRLGGLRSVSSVSSVTNQDEVVTNVVSALTPSIAAAVEEALAAQAAAEAARVEAERRAAAQAAAAAAAAAAAKANKPDTLAEPAKYNFEYKVAEDEDQVYITQNEARDGDALTGTYSFVDPRGALITVNYEAGPQGYEETREEKLGFVEIRSKPARVAPAPAPKVDQATLIQRILAILRLLALRLLVLRLRGKQQLKPPGWRLKGVKQLKLLLLPPLLLLLLPAQTALISLEVE